MRNSVHAGNIQTMSITNNTDSLIGSGIGSGLGFGGFGFGGYGRDTNDGVSLAAIASIAASQRDRDHGCHRHGRDRDDCGHTLHGIAATERARDSLTDQLNSARSELAGQIDRSKDLTALQLGQLRQDLHAHALASCKAQGEIRMDIQASKAELLLNLVKEVRESKCDVERELRCEADKTRAEIAGLKCKVEDNEKERQRDIIAALREKAQKLENDKDHIRLEALIARKCGPAATCAGNDGPGNS